MNIGMTGIVVLDRHTAELIAAGEVVERPASVVKELLENAIDAGATAVTVEIEAGGTALIRVSDNGTGIPRGDVPTAFLRHATSKVRTADDLEAIGTLGFRGEALASIAAVAKVELITRTVDETAGSCYRIEGGEPISLEDAGCPQGTTILVRDLFYNVPARMKFLRKDVSEGNAVAGVVDRLALSHPDVSFRFVREGRQELQTAGDGDLAGCIYSVFGGAFSEGLIPVEYTQGGVKVSGFINKIEHARANRTMQTVFLNGRFIKSRTVTAALEQAYKGLLMGGKFPTCVLMLDISGKQSLVYKHSVSSIVPHVPVSFFSVDSRQGEPEAAAGEKGGACGNAAVKRVFHRRAVAAVPVFAQEDDFGALPGQRPDMLESVLDPAISRRLQPAVVAALAGGVFAFRRDDGGVVSGYAQAREYFGRQIVYQQFHGRHPKRVQVKFRIVQFRVDFDKPQDGMEQNACSAMKDRIYYNHDRRRHYDNRDTETHHNDQVRPCAPGGSGDGKSGIGAGNAETQRRLA